MAQNKFRAFDTNGDEVELSALIASLGVGDALKIISTGADGRIDISFLPPGIGADTETLVCSEALSPGSWINIYDNGGVRTARMASSLDNTKPAMAFVKSAFAQSDNALVYLRGVNSQVPLGAFVPTDRGKKAFLAAAGGAQRTPPTGTGTLLQVLGPITDVAATVSVNFSYSPGTTRA